MFFFVFLLIIRIFWVLNYSWSIIYLVGVLFNVRRNFLGCFFMFVVIFIVYVGFGYFLFGLDFEIYKNMFVLIIIIVNLLVGWNSFYGLIMVCFVIVEFYYFIFVMFVIWIVMIMMCVILNRSIWEIWNKIESYEWMYEIDDFLYDFLKDFWYKIYFKFLLVFKVMYELCCIIILVMLGDVSLIL